MREFAVRYVNGPLQGQGSITQPDEAGDEPPLVQRIPLPKADHGVRGTMTDAFGGAGHAIYERGQYLDTTNEWEFSLVRVE